MVARSVARYSVAAFAFMAAATWVGISLTGGFTCLFVFVLASQTVRLYQRRSDLRSRPASSGRERRSRDEPVQTEERISSRPPTRRARSQPAGCVYDGGREESGWSVASEAAW